jgi:hypothetical protein
MDIVLTSDKAGKTEKVYMSALRRSFRQDEIEDFGMKMPNTNPGIE